MESEAQRLTPELILPPGVADIMEALHAEDLDILHAAQARAGGGTVLAARWGAHRRSDDIDVFMPKEVFDRNFDAINAMQARICQRLLPDREPNFWTNPRAGLLVIKCPASGDRALELIRDPRLPTIETAQDRGQPIAGDVRQARDSKQ